jgi:hypothetical protein
VAAVLLRQLTTAGLALLHSLVVGGAIMLILNGKFLFLNFVVLLASLLTSVGAGVQAAEARTGMKAEMKIEVKAPARAADVVATEFYGWYLETLSADQDPLSDRYNIFTRYVAKELTERLVERLQGDPPPARDYFVQSSGYRPAWLRSVRATVMRQHGGTADVLVTLGDGAEESGPRQLLALSMVVENGAWKIRRVVGVDAYSKSSAEQPAI